MNNKAEKLYFLLLESMSNYTWQEISEEYLNYINRLRLVKDDQFNKLDSAKKIELILSLNEDQITNEAKEYFSKLSEEDYKKNDLLEAVELLSSLGNEKEEMIIYSPVQLSNVSMKSIGQTIEAKIRDEIRIVFKIDQDLILGCRIEYKNQIQDYSLAKMSLPLINSLLKKVN